MTHTYLINVPPHTISMFPAHSYKKIPGNAVTHYAYRIYPATQPVPKTLAGAPRKVAKQRKIAPDAIAAPAHATVTPQVSPAPKSNKTKTKFRKNINKDALAVYFDNSDKFSVASEWLADTVAEMENKDATRNAAINNEQERLREFVESVRNPECTTPWIQKTNQVYLYVINANDAIQTLLEILAMASMAAHTTKKTNNASSHGKEINAHILHKFEQLNKKTNQIRGMKKAHHYHR